MEAKCIQQWIYGMEENRKQWGVEDGKKKIIKQRKRQAKCQNQSDWPCMLLTLLFS